MKGICDDTGRRLFVLMIFANAPARLQRQNPLLPHWPAVTDVSLHRILRRLLAIWRRAAGECDRLQCGIKLTCQVDDANL